MPTKTDPSQPVEQSIEQLQKRYHELNKEKIKAETNLANAQNRLDDLQKQAREKYGTDNLAALREQLKEITAENEAKRRQYQQDLDRIESELTTVEQKYAISDTPKESSEATL